MTWTLIALLGEASPPLRIDALQTQLSSFFEDAAAPSIEREKLPFSKEDSLALRWGTWLVRIAYEEGPEVEQDSIEISVRLGNTAPSGLSSISRRIYVVFGRDDAKKYTNEAIYIIDFLREIAGGSNIRSAAKRYSFVTKVSPQVHFS